MCGVKDRQVKYQKNRGQLFLWCISGLNILLKEFSVSLPYINFSTYSSDSESEELEHALEAT